LIRDLFDGVVLRFSQRCCDPHRVFPVFTHLPLSAAFRSIPQHSAGPSLYSYLSGAGSMLFTWKISEKIANVLDPEPLPFQDLN
jgi:hypothetical protein